MFFVSLSVFISCSWRLTPTTPKSSSSEYPPFRNSTEVMRSVKNRCLFPLHFAVFTNLLCCRPLPFLGLCSVRSWDYTHVFPIPYLRFLPNTFFVPLLSPWSGNLTPCWNFLAALLSPFKIAPCGVPLQFLPFFKPHYSRNSSACSYSLAGGGTLP